MFGNNAYFFAVTLIWTHYRPSYCKYYTGTNIMYEVVGAYLEVYLFILGKYLC
jgi:hypothetical protein